MKSDPGAGLSVAPDEEVNLLKPVINNYTVTFQAKYFRALYFQQMFLKCQKPQHFWDVFSNTALVKGNSAIDQIWG